MLLLLVLVSSVASFPAFTKSGTWAPPRPGDARSPCPGLNVLANYDYIPRDGKDIVGDDIIQAARNYFGLADPIVQVAVTNAQTHAGVFPGDVMASLDVLNATHNAIEHDASLTRSDKYLGDWIRLNATLLQQLVPDASATLTKQDIAAARTKRIKDSQRRNPTFTWSVLNQKPVSAAESAFLTLILGDSDGNIPAKYLQFFLKYEQLPTSLGWTKNDISFSAFTGLSTWFLTQEFIAFGVEENEAAKMAQGSVRKYWSLKH